MFPSVVLVIFLSGNLAASQSYPQNETKDFGDLAIRNIRLRIILDSIRAYVNQQAHPSNDKFDLLLDEQVRHANKTAGQLNQMYEAELKGAGDRTPKEATDLIVNTYSKSLQRFLNPAVALERKVWRTTTEKPTTYTEDYIVKSLRDYWKTVEEERVKVEDAQEPASETPGGNQNLETIVMEAKRNAPQMREINESLGPSFMIPQQGVVPENLAPFQQRSPKELKEMLKFIIMDEFKMLETTENLSESTNLEHSPMTLKILENTTINELVFNLGEDCLSMMLCNAGADPRSMGSFGPWAVERFDGKQQRMVSYIHPKLTSAYLEGQRQMGNFMQYCAEKFNKCNLRL